MTFVIRGFAPRIICSDSDLRLRAEAAEAGGLQGETVVREVLSFHSSLDEF